MIEKVKSHLKPKRYKHTLGVIKLAVRLAKYYGEDIKKAELAALLHDYSKYESDQVILDYMRTLGPVHPVIERTPNLGHCYHSAYLAKTIFAIEDEEILNAIKYHTFGHEEMTMLEKIIYVSDSLEETRHYEGIEEVRALLFEDFNRALLMSIENTLHYEIEKGHMLHEDTIKLRNKLLEATWIY